MELPTVSVVMTTYDRKDILPQVVAPLLEDPAATEVIVVVDGCRDGSHELLTELAASEPRLKPIFIENRGQTGAQQVGVETATGDVILLMDDDVVAAPGLVAGHARHHADTRSLIVLGYMPTRVPRTKDAATFSTILYAQEYEQVSQGYVDDPDSILRGFWMGNFSLRRDDCLRIGLFNPSYDSICSYYHVDRDFGLRCLRGGLAAVHDRTLRGDHSHGRTLAAFLEDARRQGKGQVVLHGIHEDLIGPISLDSFSADLARPVRAVVRAARRERVRVPLLALLRSCVRLAGALRLTSVQLPVAKVARRIEQERGAIEAFSSAVPAPEPPGS